MAIHNEEVQEMEVGISKGIEKSAMGLIMENLQRYQYQYPVKSTVRELVSNGIDSVAEKNAALDILSGAPVSKYYVEKEGALYKDSKFDPLYYDPKWLSDDNKVYVTYQEGSNQQKDCAIIEDFGTGLGGRRLQGYFQLGYSTKRLSKLPLGKFGIGAKSALSVGVRFFTVESRYNGKLFRFNVYSSKVDSIIPQFNLDKGTENGFVLFGDQKVYYESTDEKNGVTVIIEAKKHHKQQYIDAVKSQLLYFPNIDFSIVHSGSSTRESIEYRANIFYEDDYIVLSDNSVWSKPHLLLNKVNYGYIDFDELELEDKYGNIGIKVDPEDVEINPSRESIIWSDKTKKMVLDRYKTVVDIATRFIQEELKETDIVKWLRVCYQISNQRWGRPDSVANRLSGIIDMTQVEPLFPADNRIKFSPSKLFMGLLVRLYTMESGKRANRNTRKVERKELKYGLGDHNWLPIVLIDENTSVRKDKYMLSKMYTDGFIGIKAPDLIKESTGDVEITDKLLKQLNLFEEQEVQKDTVDRVLKMAPIVWKCLNESSEAVMYSSIEVPDDFVCTEEDEEDELETEEEAAESALASLTATERRKQEGKILVYTPYFLRSTPRTANDRLYCMTKIEVPIKDLNDWDQEEIYYGNDGDLELLHFAAFITREVSDVGYDAARSGRGLRSFSTHFDNNCTHYCQNMRGLRLIKVARSSNRLLSDFKPIQKFFVDIKNGQITMSNALIRWNTARQIAERINEMSFLWNFGSLDEERSNKFRELVRYVEDNYTEPSSNATTFGANTEAFKDLITHLDKVQSFQLFVAAGHEASEVAEFAAEVFGNATLVGGVSIDAKTWEDFNDLLEYSQVLSPLLNEMPVLTGIGYDHDVVECSPLVGRSDYTICSEVEMEIRQYMRAKGVL